ncbi:MAG: hypothetical protein QM755_06955 [Luteolibacter sp.]
MGLDDMFSSGRGAGMMGTLMAAGVLGGFVLLYIFVFDESMAGGGKKIEAVIRDQDAEIRRLEAAIEQRSKTAESFDARRAVFTELEQVKRKLSQDQGDIDARASLIPRIQSEIEQAQAKSEAYKQAFRAQVRNEGKGTTYPQLKTLSGKVYETVVVTKVDAVGMNIQHKDGTSRVEFENLPPEIGEHFHYTPEEQKLALKSEADGYSAHSAAIDREKTASAPTPAEPPKPTASAPDATAEIAGLQATISQLGTDIAAAEQQMRAARQSSNIFNPAPYQARINNLEAKRNAAMKRLEQIRAAARTR